MYRFLRVPSEPDCGEMAPTKLALDNVTTVLEGITYSHSVVATAPVILCTFVLRRVVSALAAQILLFHQLLLLIHKCRIDSPPRPLSLSLSAAFEMEIKIIVLFNGLG